MGVTPACRSSDLLSPRLCSHWEKHTRSQKHQHLCGIYFFVCVCVFVTVMSVFLYFAECYAWQWTSPPEPLAYAARAATAPTHQRQTHQQCKKPVCVSVCVIICIEQWRGYYLMAWVSLHFYLQHFMHNEAKQHQNHET